MAIGFVLFAAGHFACMFVAESRVPASQLFRLAGYQVQEGYLYELDVDTDGRSTLRLRRLGVSNGITIVRAANAAGAMLAGLIGCVVGALAYRHSTAA